MISLTLQKYPEQITKKKIVKKLKRSNLHLIYTTFNKWNISFKFTIFFKMTSQD